MLSETHSIQIQVLFGFRKQSVRWLCDRETVPNSGLGDCASGLRRYELQSGRPPQSYINIQDYSSPKDLAEFLEHLASNETAYKRYFDWKKTHRIITLGDPKGPMPMAFCTLCELVNRPSFHKIYLDMASWWSQDRCKPPTFLLNQVPDVRQTTCKIKERKGQFEWVPRSARATAILNLHISFIFRAFFEKKHVGISVVYMFFLYGDHSFLLNVRHQSVESYGMVRIKKLKNAIIA